MKVTNLNKLLIVFLTLGTLFLSSCTKDNENTDEDKVNQEAEVYFRMKDSKTNKSIFDISIDLVSAKSDYNVYGTATSGTSTDPTTGETVNSAIYTVGVADSIQILWETPNEVGIHEYKYDTNDETEGEVSYIIINPVTQEPGYIFSMKKLELSLLSIGDVGGIMKGSFTAEIAYFNTNTQPGIIEMRPVTVDFAVPRYQ